MSSEEILKIQEMLEDHGRRLMKLETGVSSTSTPRGEKKASIKEFIIQCTPSTDIERSAVFGYYLENFKNFECFTAKDIEKAFREAREKVPKNTNDKIGKCVDKGWMMEFDEKKDNLKAYVMTRTGEGIVKNNFRGKENEN